MRASERPSVTILVIECRRLSVTPGLWRAATFSLSGATPKVTSNAPRLWRPTSQRSISMRSSPSATLQSGRFEQRLPIVAGTDDLVGEGHAVSLSHPGGSVTGISILASELNSTRLDVLKEAVPSVSRVAVLWDPATGTFHLPTLRSVAQTLGIELQVHEVTGSENLIKALDAAQAWGAEAMNVLASPT